MKLVITGATGYFGQEFIRNLSTKNKHDLIIASSDLLKARSIFPDDSITVLSNNDLITDRILDNSCILIHASFCRRSNGSMLAQSLDFTRRLFQSAVDHNVKGIVNLSSQSIYGGGKGKLGDETATPAPEYLYALAKYGAEALLHEAAHFNLDIAYSNIRLASLMGATNTVPHNVLYHFICMALAGNDISVVGGTQKFSFLDVHDAAEAIARLIEKDTSEWNHTYNLGPETQTGIVEMAELVRDIVAAHTGKKVTITVKSDDDHPLNAGMDSAKLYSDLQWKPAWSFAQIVEDTMHFVIQHDCEERDYVEN